MIPSHSDIRKAFSLLEVLLAVFILGIGLILVASVFPVGANWTKQSADDSISQTVALNALSIIHNHYDVGGNLHGNLASAPIGNALQALPGFTGISVTERSYRYGNSQPFPVDNPQKALFFWTALARVSQANPTSSSKTYDLYVFVFRKGDISQTYFAQPPDVTTGYPVPSGYTEMIGDRDAVNLVVPPLAMQCSLEPTLISGPYAAGTLVSGQITGAIPPIGAFGVGTISGTVFRQSINYTAGTAATSPPITAASEPIIYAPPADGTGGSPLVYIFQTTVSF